MMMMTPYFHFTGGDNLFFASWMPSSSGAIAGACIGLFVLTLIERGLAAFRGVLEARWKSKCVPRFSPLVHGPALAVVSGKQKGDARASTQSSDEDKGATSAASSVKSTRVFAPFIAANDVPRGIAYVIQMLLAYVLMLAVMTFNAAYIITIILGLGIGEVVFGRFGGAHGHVH
ncbi:hypothetical protein PLICRDRAFT_99956 [Plicaturopsis crispa FD-325 SS-3]|nr:hypothetical protein PLICRDRAFT_99956 [Plicaturopsis crispa FD-325 SS-3]